MPNCGKYVQGGAPLGQAPVTSRARAPAAHLRASSPARLPPALLLGAALLALLVALPAAAAGPVLELEASSARVAGTGAFDGPLRALRIQDNGYPERMGPPDFRLTAGSLEVQVDTIDATLAAMGYPSRLLSSSYTDAAVTGLEAHGNHRFFVFPLAEDRPLRATGSGSCFQLAPADQDLVNGFPFVNRSRPALRVGTATALAWSDCDGDATATITGDFVVLLWEVDAYVTGREGDQLVRTGHHANDADPTAASYPIVTELTEAFLYVTNGTLTLPRLPPADGYRMFIEGGATYTATGMASLEAAHGRLQGLGPTQEVPASTVVAAGQLALQATKQDGLVLAATVSGDLASVRSDGHEMVPPAGTYTVTVTKPDVVLAALLAASVLLAGLLLGAWMFPPWYYRQLQSGRGFLGLHKPETRRERRAMGYWAMARRAHDLGWHRLSLRLAGLGLRLAPGILDHRLMQGLALHSLRRWNDVLQCLAPIQARLPSARDRAATAMLLSEACLRLGDLEEAQLWCQAGQEAPEVRERELRNPVFAPLRALRQPDEGDPSVA